MKVIPFRTKHFDNCLPRSSLRLPYKLSLSKISACSYCQDVKVSSEHESFGSLTGHALQESKVVTSYFRLPIFVMFWNRYGLYEQT